MEIISGRGSNGAIIHGLLLLSELVRRGHNVTLVCLPNSWVEQEVVQRKIAVNVVLSDLHRWPMGELHRIAGIIRDRKIEVVHTHMSRAHSFGVAVATAQQRHIQLHWMFNDRVIAVSDADRRYQHTHNLVRKSRLATIPNFIDTHRLLELPDDTRSKVRGWLGAADDAFLMGIIGNIIPRKGLIHLVRALPKIVARVPAARLVVIGGDTQSDYAIRARSVAKSQGVSSHIVWTGPRDDVHEILAALDLYTLPSLEESTPLSILEAMGAGLPVVATTAGGIPECVLDGVTGLLVPPARSERLADAILALVDDPARRRRFGEAGRRRVLEVFSPEVQTRRVEAVFESVTHRQSVA
jgi:glycosyltransferase involved in cell wall biosynthesis